MVDSIVRPSCDGYVVGKKLGQGSFGVVRSVTKDGEEYAMKIFKQNIASRPQFIEETQAEYDIVSQLDIDDICKYHDLKHN